MSLRFEASACAKGQEGIFKVSSAYRALRVFGAGMTSPDAFLPLRQNFWGPTAPSSSLATEASWDSAPSTWMSTVTGYSSGGRMCSTRCSWMGPARMPRR